MQETWLGPVFAPNLRARPVLGVSLRRGSGDGAPGLSEPLER
jgi:hypothetical protein